MERACSGGGTPSTGRRRIRVNRPGGVGRVPSQRGGRDADLALPDASADRSLPWRACDRDLRSGADPGTRSSPACSGSSRLSENLLSPNELSSAAWPCAASLRPSGCRCLNGQRVNCKLRTRSPIGSAAVSSPGATLRRIAPAAPGSTNATSLLSSRCGPTSRFHAPAARGARPRPSPNHAARHAANAASSAWRKFSFCASLAKLASKLLRASRYACCAVSCGRASNVSTKFSLM
jgi:hypothetical protein